ncbi:15694_t:CDS:2 [Acaulospora morrowiae]|uniref:15694_t:CDS:1 n=1 Tax=Acaulospora morrowiae TaxID=94023 RepID=A0A9N9EJU6_9GLOM|nr:15694_t:CDS:2 [Acaulospora morrowiae]
MPSGKDLDCGDSRKRDHNAKDCSRKGKFSQESSGMKRSQSDKDGKLGSSSKDSYTTNYGKCHDEGMDLNLRRKSKPLEETTDNYLSEILEEYYKEMTAEPPDETLKSAYNEASIRDNVIMEKKEEDDITGEPTDAIQRPYCNETREYKVLQYSFRNNKHLDNKESDMLVNLPDNFCNEKEQLTIMDNYDQEEYATVQKEPVTNKLDLEDTWHTIKEIGLLRNF